MKMGKSPAPPGTQGLAQARKLIDEVEAAVELTKWIAVYLPACTSMNQWTNDNECN